MKKLKKFTYKVSGLKGSVVYTDFQTELELTIEAEKISEATDKITQYFADNFLNSERIVLVKIEC